MEINKITFYYYTCLNIYIYIYKKKKYNNVYLNSNSDTVITLTQIIKLYVILLRIKI